MNYNLPGLTKRDMVREIEIKHENEKRKKNAERCFGTGSCDCKRCK